MGQGEVGGCTQRVWPAMSAWAQLYQLALGGPFLSLLGINGLGNKLLHLVEPPFLAFKAHFSAIYVRLAFPRSLG